MATNKVKFQSPFGTARYPHISKPDTVGKFADNKYKTKLVCPLGDPETQDFIKTIKQAAVDLHGQKGLKMYLPYTEDEESNEAVFVFKTQYAPAVFDSQGKPVDNSSSIGGGSIIRLAGAFVPFEKGISAQINHCQVKELNGFGECPFDTVEDGYEFVSSGPSEDFRSNDLENSGAESRSYEF